MSQHVTTIFIVLKVTRILGCLSRGFMPPCYRIGPARPGRQAQYQTVTTPSERLAEWEIEITRSGPSVPANCAAWLNSVFHVAKVPRKILNSARGLVTGVLQRRGLRAVRLF